MTIRSLGLRTDILALGPGSTVEPAEGGYALRTPAEPDYWSANALIRTTLPEAPAQEIARFRRVFPGSTHVRLDWDGHREAVLAQASAWEVLGVEVEVDDVLAREGAPPRTPLPDGYAIRAMETPKDWDRSFDLNRLIGAEDGFGGTAFDAYLRRRRDARVAGVREGWMRWWGVWHGDALVAQMGLAEGDAGGERLGRFQHVETHPDHRRRGLCAALLAHVANEAHATRLVIVAEADGDAGRFYRRAGFALFEQKVGVLIRDAARLTPAAATP